MRKIRVGAVGGHCAERASFQLPAIQNVNRRDQFFFFKQTTAYEIRPRDWSSDVCSSDLRDRSDHFALAKHSHHWHWPELIAAHRAEAFSPWMIAGFDNQTAGCPEEFSREAAALGPTPEYGESWGDATLGLEKVREALRSPLSPDFRQRRWLIYALARDVIDAGEVATTGRPAAIALAEVHRRCVDTVAELLAESINGDADAWMLVLGMVRDFQGSLPELLGTAKAAVG